MRIFVGEYVTGGGLAEQAIDEIPSSLRREGAAMLQSIVSDLAEVAETVVPLDPRFANAFSKQYHRHGRHRPRSGAVGAMGHGCTNMRRRFACRS